MRVAFVGKGGAGKSVIAGTFARLLARRGHEVLAVDSDPMPGLAFSLGVASTDAAIPEDAVEESQSEEGPRFLLRETAEKAVERYASAGPDGVRFLQYGKLWGPAGPYVRSQHAFRQILEALSPERWSVVGDLPGGTRQPFFGWAGFASLVLVVAEPTAKGLLSARRLERLALLESPPRLLVVASKVRSDADVARVVEATGLAVAAAVPLDEAVVDAERAGRPVVEASPRSPAVEAIRLLVDELGEDGL